MVRSLYCFGSVVIGCLGESIMGLLGEGFDTGLLFCILDVLRMVCRSWA